MNPNCNTYTGEGDCYTPPPEPVVIHPGHWLMPPTHLLPDTGSNIGGMILVGVGLIIVGLIIWGSWPWRRRRHS